jgi:recombination protein RecT
MTCAQLGLRPGVGGLGHAWLIPFKGQAQLVIGYQGYAELAHRTGRVASLIARPVHANDEFEVDYGLADNLVHRPLMFADRGDVIGYYAIVKFQSGGHAFDVMSRSDVEGHRDRFAMARNREGQIIGPWVDHFDSMALKTVFKRLMKWAPKSPELVSALGADETVRDDISLDAMPVPRDDVIDGEVTSDVTAPDAEPAAEGPSQEETAEHAAALAAEQEAGE